MHLLLNSAWPEGEQLDYNSQCIWLLEYFQKEKKRPFDAEFGESAHADFDRNHAMC